MFALSKRTIDSSAAVLERIELATGCGRSAALGIGRHSRFTKLEKMAAVVSYPSFCGCTLMPQDTLYEPEAPRIRDLISRCGMSAVFQPVANFESGAICGYEGLIWGQRARRSRCLTSCFRRQGLKAALSNSTGLLRESVSKRSRGAHAMASYFLISVRRRFGGLRSISMMRLISSRRLG